MIDRYHLPELTWSQALASPEGKMREMLESGVLGVTYQFAASCKDEQGWFKTESAKLHLKGIWNTEKEILEKIGNYPKLNAERNIGDSYSTESVSVTYDYIGHLILCTLAYWPKWKDYILKEHESEVRSLARFGSWRARELLDLDKTQPYLRPSDEEIALRFFFGDVTMMRALRSGYAGERS